MDRMVCHVAGKNIGRPVATFHDENCEANARLFVHAAELVEAAKCLEVNIMDNDELRMSEPSSVALRDLRRIISQIEGKKS